MPHRLSDPLCHVVRTGLVMRAETSDIMWQLVGAVAGVWFATGAIYGCLTWHLGIVERALLAAIALAAILPLSLGWGGYLVNLLAIFTGVALTFRTRLIPRLSGRS